MKYLNLSLLTLFLLLAQFSFGQNFIITGKVSDAESGDPIPFASVFVKGNKTGAQTDFDGFYTLKLNELPDSIGAIYLGYKPRMRKVKKAPKQTIDFQLNNLNLTFKEIEITPGENPAWEIMRRVILNKPVNDYRSLSAFQYETYNRLEVDVDNVSDKMKKRRAFRKITALMDSIEQLKGENGQTILPIFVSEALSKYYYRKEPNKRNKEILLNSKVTGIGVDDGSLITQMVGATFQQFNFYESWIEVATKSFASPITESWNLMYNYDLVDSMFVDEEWCYRIKVDPKREKDLAFSGTIWIAKGDYGLKQLDITARGTANINFIDKIKIQQKLEKTIAGAWLPSKTRIVIDIAEVSKTWAGMLAKSYTSNKNMEVNLPYNDKFYDPVIESAEVLQSKEQAEKFWEDNRHDSLTRSEKQVFKMIDTVNNLPVVRSYVEIANIFINGYKKVNTIDIGPYLSTYAFNNIEGHRIRLGVRTNSYFNNRITFEGYGAFGTRDQRFKYGSNLSYILTRKPFTQVGIFRNEDIEQVALNDNTAGYQGLFSAFVRFGNITNYRPYYNNEVGSYFTTELRRGLQSTLTFRNKSFDPLYIGFKYPVVADNPDGRFVTNFTVTEFEFENRFDPQAIFLYKKNNNQRVSVSPRFSPVFYLKYTLGVRDLFFGDYNYHKFTFKVWQNVKTGVWGTGRYDFDAGFIPGTLPYPLLRTHLGNSTPIFITSAYNLMVPFEFVSDRYVSLSYMQYFEGLFLNAVPVLSKLKLRTTAYGKILFGGVSPENKRNAIIDGERQFNTFNHRPYAEVGYGVENIFKVARIDFIHRLTYLDNPRARPFGVKISFQFKI